MARRRKRNEDEHENHERWLVSYADFITLLFAFFVVMYSLSSINEGKYRIMSDSVVNAFRNIGVQSANPRMSASPIPSIRPTPPAPSEADEARKARAERVKNMAEEIRKVLAPLVADGQVVITGFNPYSLFGLRRLAAGECMGYPWHGQYLSQHRLKDWLALLGFEMRLCDAGCYIPGVEQEQWIERLRLLDRAGRRWWPFMGGVYMVQAIKRVQGMRLIMPRWDRKAGARALAPLVQKSTAPRAGCAQQNRNDVYFGRD